MNSTPTPAIVLDGLHQSFGAVHAVKGASFTVERGQVFCLVGPNGAGKTTTVECITGLQTPDAGIVRVLDQHPQRNRSVFFESVGVQFQENSLYQKVKVGEAIRTFARLYRDPRDPSALLDLLGLTDRENTFYKNLSGGERRKLLLAVALVGQPELVILDEPTTGLDPHARRALWRILHRFREDEGLTVLLTTHDMQEAEEESDVVCVMDQGEVIATGPPQVLVDEYQLGTRVSVSLNGHDLEEDTFQSLPGLTRSDTVDQTLHLYGMGDAFTSAATEALQNTGIHDFTVRPAGLEDLYLIITGSRYSS